MEKVLGSLSATEGHIERFLDHMPTYRDYDIEKVAIAPVISRETDQHIRERGWLAEDLCTLTQGLE